MVSAVLAIVIPSSQPSICLSVTAGIKWKWMKLESHGFYFWVAPKFDTQEYIFSKYIEGSPPAKALNVSRLENLGDFEPLSCSVSKMVEDSSIDTVDY